MKNYLCFLFLIIGLQLAKAQIQPAGVRIIDDLSKAGLNAGSGKRSVQNPKSCTTDTVEYPRYKASTLLTVSVAKGRGLGQLYSCPKPLVVTGFTFYAFVLPIHKTAKKMELICRLYKAGADSLPSGSPLRSDTLSIDSTLMGGRLVFIEKHASFTSITLDSNYIITVETNDDTLTAGIVTNNYQNRDGDRENLNCGSISGLWYNGRNLNVGGQAFDCDILLHPHVKYQFGTDFSIKNNCYNVNDSIRFTNAAPFNMAGSKMYNQYLINSNFNWAIYCHLWDVGNFSGSMYAVNRTVKYNVKQNYKVRLISTIYGYRGSMRYGCTDTTVKELLFKPDIPTFSGLVNVCMGDTARYTALSADTGVVFEWFSSPGASSPFFTGKTYQLYPVTQNDTFYLRANNRGCVSGFRTVIIKANAYPTVLNVLNDSVCAGSKANLKASSNIGSVQWYTAATGGLPFFSGEVFQTGNLTDDTTFYVQAGNNGCIMSPRLAVSALVGSDFAPAAPVLSNDTTVCLAATTSLVLNASAGSGLSIRWFNAASGGSSIQNGSTYTFTPVKREVRTFYADAYNGICGSTRVPVHITVEDFPAISSIVNAAACKGDSVRMAFNLPFGSAGWYNADTGGTLLHSGNSFTVAPPASTDFYVETGSSVCVDPQRTKITAVINEAPLVLKLWGDTICAKNRATLKSKISGAGTMEWFDSDTSGTVLFSGSTYLTPVLNGSRKYYARAAYAGCYGPRTAVQPLVRPVPFSGFSFEVLTWQQVRVAPINAGGASIKWHFGDGTTSNNSSVTHRYQNTGSYQIKLVLTSPITGCKDSSTVTVQIDPSSLHGVYSDKPLHIFPNPVSGLLYVELPEANSVHRLQVYSLNGMLVLEKELEAGLRMQDLDVSALNSGMYVLVMPGYSPALFVRQ